MLIIRNEQMDVLKEYRYQIFERFMLDYLRGLFPKPCQKLGAKGLLQLIQKGKKDAAKYEIEVYCDVAQFISLFFFLSNNFYKNPKYPWAREILTDKTISTKEKLDLLFERTKEEHRRSKAERSKANTDRPSPDAANTQGDTK